MIILKVDTCLCLYTEFNLSFYYLYIVNIFYLSYQLHVDHYHLKKKETHDVLINFHLFLSIFIIQMDTSIKSKDIEFCMIFLNH